LPVPNNKKQMVATLAESEVTSVVPVSEMKAGPVIPVEVKAAVAVPQVQPTSEAKTTVLAPAEVKPEPALAIVEVKPDVTESQVQATTSEAKTEHPGVKAPADMLVRELKDELTKRGLDANGSKAVLVKRLQEALAPALPPEIPTPNAGDETVTTSIAEAKPLAPEPSLVVPEPTTAISSVWNDMTVTQLKAELKKRNLEEKGKKNELIARLEASESVTEVRVEEKAPKQDKHKDVEVPMSADDESPSQASSGDKENAPAPTTKPNYKDWVVRDLQAELKKKGLDTGGKKVDLIARLEVVL